MKKIIFTLILASASYANAQVIIGDAIGTATTKTSVLLEFAAGQNKGIIIPYVRTLPTGAALVGGSIVLDATTPATARMKFYNGTGWIDLSGQDADVTPLLVNQPTTIAPITAHAIIGDAASTVDGVLVLESTTKAMILPIVADVDNIPTPSAGMMVYVNKTGAKRLAVYNGSKWSFFQQ